MLESSTFNSMTPKIFGRGDSARSPSSHLPMGHRQLNDDILHYLVPYLSPETLRKVNAVNRVFFNAWMKFRYESLILTQDDKRLLDRLIGNPHVAKYVKWVLICPWFINHPGAPARLHQTIWTGINKIIDSAYVAKKRERGLRKDSALVLRALSAMENLQEYLIVWNEDSLYHPEFYKACFTPISQKWPQLSALTIKIPSQLLKSLASIRLGNLETLEYHFCTGQMSCQDIDEMYNGVLVFVNNFKDSLGCLSFVSTHTPYTLDITRIYRSLGHFPKLRSISLTVHFNAAHLADPLAFVEFLEKHRSMLEHINVLTSRCTRSDCAVQSMPSNLENIQKILTSIHSPFPRLRSLALALPFRAPLTIVSDFLEMHMATLDSLILADRALGCHELERLFKISPFIFEGLRHLRVGLITFCTHTLFYLASRMPGLTSLDIECHSLSNSCNAQAGGGIDLTAFCSAIIENDLLANWKLQRVAIGPQGQLWVPYIEHALVECMPNLRIG